MNGLIQPKVVVWFKVYCWLWTVLGLAAILLVLYPHFSSSETYDINMVLVDFDSSWVEIGVMSLLEILIMGFGLAMLAVTLPGICLKPRPWVWVYNLMLICFGITTGWFVPLCIPLLLFWVKKGTKAYYGRGD